MCILTIILIFWVASYKLLHDYHQRTLPEHRRLPPSKFDLENIAMFLTSRIPGSNVQIQNAEASPIRRIIAQNRARKEER